MSLDDLLTQASLASTAGDGTDLGRVRASVFRCLRDAGWGPSLLPREVREDEPADSDAVLLAAFVAGKGEAFDGLFNRYAPRLNGYARRWLHGPDAEDAVQGTFLLFFEKANEILGREAPNVAGFLFAALRFKLLRLHAKYEIPSPDVAADEVSLADDGFTALLRREEAGRLARWIDRACNPLEARVVMLDLEDRSDAEIAAALEISAGHVRVTRHRAHAKLRRAIADEEPPAR